jgi:hypothetical protein
VIIAENVIGGGPFFAKLSFYSQIIEIATKEIIVHLM